MAQDFLLETLIKLPGILIGFTFHEYAHAYAAHKFGDPTPERQGRLTANPLAHIDLWGFLLILFANFGWAKPVETNPSYYRGDARKKDLIVSLVGPLANLAIAMIFVFIILVIGRTGLVRTLGVSSANILVEILYSTAWINCILFIFNLVPIPPLDGFHILSDIVPESSYRLIYTMERYGYIILLVFILSPLSDLVIRRGAGFVYKTMFLLMGMQ